MSRRATATLKPAVLNDLLVNEAVDSVLIQGVEGGFRILIGFGDEEKPLGLAREDRERLFKTLASAANYLMKLGIAHSSLDMTLHCPSQPKPAQPPKGPGRRAARERTEEAIVQDASFYASIEEAISQIDAGTAELTLLTRESYDAIWDRAVANVEARRQAITYTDASRNGVERARRDR